MGVTRIGNIGNNEESICWWTRHSETVTQWHCQAAPESSPDDSSGQPPAAPGRRSVTVLRRWTVTVPAGDAGWPPPGAAHWQGRAAWGSALRHRVRPGATAGFGPAPRAWGSAAPLAQAVTAESDLCNIIHQNCWQYIARYCSSILFITVFDINQLITIFYAIFYAILLHTVFVNIVQYCPQYCL